MKITWRIWLLSLIIQPIMFGPLGLFVIPIEIIYSLPGILIFWLLVQLIVFKNMPLQAKWILLYIAGAATAFLSSYIFLYGDSKMGLFDDDNEWLFLLPAPAAAILAIVLSRKHIRKHFNDTTAPIEIAEHPIPEYHNPI